MEKMETGKRRGEVPGEIARRLVENLVSGGQYDFSGFREASDACIQIVSAFQLLHNRGYFFRDWNCGYLWVGSENENMILDLDKKILALGEGTEHGRDLRFTAPEALTGQGKVLPNEYTDRYSLAVILFLILFQNHPLEGKRSLVPCLTDAVEQELYGSNPLFICEPEDVGNAPLRNSPVRERWGCMPDYIKDAFMAVFGRQALKEPEHRLSECDWLKTLVRLRSGVVTCSCGNEVVVRDGAAAACGHCGRQAAIERFLKLPEYFIPAAKGSRVYRCQLGACNAGEALDPVLLVVAKPDGILGVKNMTPGILGAVTPSGSTRQIQPQEVIPFKPGIKIEAFDKTIELA